METTDIDYKKYCEELQKKIEEIKVRDNAIINQLNEEIEFYKNVIKGILHIKQRS